MSVQQLGVILECLSEEVSSRSFYSAIYPDYFLKTITILTANNKQTGAFSASSSAPDVIISHMY